jgi:maltooligosyltrehalose trehalohydrolase
MLFQGQEMGATTPFLYFADPPEWLREVVIKGRKEFLEQWRTLRTPEMSSHIHDPTAVEAFKRSKLDRSATSPELYALHCDLLKLRRDDPAIAGLGAGTFDGAILSGQAFVFRIFNQDHGDRLLVVNLGRDLRLDPAPEPLLAPPEDQCWSVLFSTEHPRYGGYGTAPPEEHEIWSVPGQSALLLAPQRRENRQE